MVRVIGPGLAGGRADWALDGPSSEWLETHIPCVTHPTGAAKGS